MAWAVCGLVDFFFFFPPLSLSYLHPASAKGGLNPYATDAQLSVKSLSKRPLAHVAAMFFLLSCLIKITVLSLGLVAWDPVFEGAEHFWNSYLESHPPFPGCSMEPKRWFILYNINEYNISVSEAQWPVKIFWVICVPITNWNSFKVIFRFYTEKSAQIFSFLQATKWMALAEWVIYTTNILFAHFPFPGFQRGTWGRVKYNQHSIHAALVCLERTWFSLKDECSYIKTNWI